MERIVYRETFPLISQKDSFIILMTLIAHYNLELHQMNIKITFLNRNLEEEIYMNQPNGFEDKEKENLKCKLKKSIYELKVINNWKSLL